MLKDERIRVLWLIKGLGLGGAEMLFDMAAPHVDRSRFDYEVGYFLPWKDALAQKLQPAPGRPSPLAERCTCPR